MSWWRFSQQSLELAWVKAAKARRLWAGRNCPSDSAGCFASALCSCAAMGEFSQQQLWAAGKDKYRGKYQPKPLKDRSVGRWSQHFKRLKWEGHKFKSNLGNLARLCLKVKSKTRAGVGLILQSACLAWAKNWVPRAAPQNKAKPKKKRKHRVKKFYRVPYCTVSLASSLIKLVLFPYNLFLSPKRKVWHSTKIMVFLLHIRYV